MSDWALEGFKALFDEAEASREYWVELASLSFTDEIARLMDERDVTKAELARRLHSSPAHVTQLLRGGTNPTLKSMTKVCLALGCELRVHAAPRGSRTRWLDEIDAQRDYTGGRAYDVGSDEKAAGHDVAVPIAA